MRADSVEENEQNLQISRLKWIQTIDSEDGEEMVNVFPIQALSEPREGIALPCGTAMHPKAEGLGEWC